MSLFSVYVSLLFFGPIHFCEFVCQFVNLFVMFLRFHIQMVSSSIGLCLTHFTWRNALQVHLCGCQRQNFVSFLWG